MVYANLLSFGNEVNLLIDNISVPTPILRIPLNLEGIDRDTNTGIHLPKLPIDKLHCIIFGYDRNFIFKRTGAFM